MKIQNFDRQTVQTAREILKAAFIQIESQTGLKIQLGAISFSAKEFHGKLTAMIPDDSEIQAGVSATEIKYRHDFKKYFWKFSMNSDALDTTRRNNEGERYTLVGLASKSPKFPLIAKRKSDGKYIKLTVSYWNSLTA